MERNSDNEHRQGSQETDGSAHPAPSSGDQGATVPQGRASATRGQDGPSEGEGQGAEIVVGEVAGYRFWWPYNNTRPAYYNMGRVHCLYTGERVLGSIIYTRCKWLPRTIIYVGELDRGVSKCGIHAFKDRRLAFREMRSFAARPAMGALGLDYLVGGVVELWGSVAEHDWGYRAQYAAIRSIDWAGQETSPGAQEWAAMYGVSYEPHEEHN